MERKTEGKKDLMTATKQSTEQPRPHVFDLQLPAPQIPSVSALRLLLRGPEVAQALGISRALAYKWMADGTLPTVRISRSVRVPHAALLAWIEANTSQTAVSPGGGATGAAA